VGHRVVHLRSGEIRQIADVAAPLAPEEVVW
jgi:hypothetical protein